MSAEPEKLGVIYNPKAGTRKVQKRWKEIKEYMDSKGVPYDYVQSEGFGSGCIDFCRLCLFGIF